jgi:peptidoglycan/xylan/chitin deacetylase (PgdA/CDA1 family)
VKVVFSIDVEAHRTLKEISGGEDSLGRILDAFARYKTIATFFVDICEVETWGFEYVQSICDRIRRGGHELALHVHPHHFTKDNKRWHLSEYSEDEQRVILRYAIEQFQRVVGEAPILFRAGGFGLNDATIKILAEEGIRCDSSFVPEWPGCQITVPTSAWRAFFTIGQLRELPPTAVVGLSILGKHLRIQALDFNWMPLFFIKRVLRRLRRANSDVAVLLMHSSSMMRRVSSTEVEYKEGNYRKLCDLLEHVNRLDQLQTIAGCDDFWQLGSQSRGQMWVERNMFVQYILLLYQSFVGKGHSRKFFLFWWGHVAVVLILVVAPILLVAIRS